MSLIHSDIRTTLNDLRGRIRRYLLIEGLAAATVVLGVMFWVSLWLDIGWFHLTLLELPGWFRQTYLLMMLAVLIGVLLSWVVLRLATRFRARALALVLERRFRQLNDRLITAVELAGEVDDPKSLKSAMARRTVNEAAEQLRSIDLDEVFDTRRLRRALTLAGVLVATIIGFGVINQAALGRWVNAFLLGQPNYWDPFRESSLTVRILAQPGDRIREFDADGVYRHPRGTDLTLIIESRDSHPAPELVTIASRCYAPTGTRADQGRAARIREREFRHTLQRVIDDHDLWIKGGDFINRTPLRIMVVDPPRLAEVRLDCDYPEYIGREQEQDRQIVVQGAQVSLPIETMFTLIGTSNKPLRAMQMRSSLLDLELRASAPSTEAEAPVGFSARLVVRGGDEETSATVLELPAEQIAAWFSDDRQTFQIPFHLALTADQMLSGLALRGEASVPIPLPPDLPLQITLEDDDEIFSLDPSRMTIRGQLDQPPVIEIRRVGVSSAITRRATVPIAGRITDDYGLLLAEFAYRTRGETEFSRAPMSRLPLGSAEFILRTSEEERYERFDVLPLALQDGNTLTLTVIAMDGDNINGPNVSQGELYEFTIVPPEEILALLAEKELNLRQRLEQIAREIQASRAMLLDARQQIERREDLLTQEASLAEVNRLSGLIETTQQRTSSDIHKNHTETRTIELLMGEIRFEMINNRIDSREALERIDRGILAHLQVINEQDFPELDEALALFGLANQSRTNPREHLEHADVVLERLLRRIDIILAEMRRRESFNELREILARMLEQQRSILEETKDAQTRDLFESTQ